MPPITPPMKAPGSAAAAADRRRYGGDRRRRRRCGAGPDDRRTSSLEVARRRDDFAQQRLVLQLVEVAALGIAAGGLPARDHRAGRFVELAGHLGVEAEAVEPALHVAALALVEADLVFGGLVGFLVEGRGIDAGGQVAGRGRRPVLQRGDPGQRQRLELAVGIAGQIGVELFRLVGFLDRAPELELDVRGGRGRRHRRRGGCRPARPHWRRAAAAGFR